MQKIPRVLIVLAVVFTPGLVSAQGGRGGGFGRGGQGRGQRGQNDSTPSGGSRVPLSFADMVFAHRADLQLTDSETIKVSDIRMSAMSRRAVLNNEVDSLKAEMTTNPTDAATPPTDSSRKEIMGQRRAMAVMLGELHDVDVNARNATLVVLTPTQQKKAETLEEAANSPPPQNRGFGGGGRPGGGRPGNGMGHS